CPRRYCAMSRNQEITRFSGAEAGPYLEPSQGAASLSLFSILHKTLRPPVRAAVTKAGAENVRVGNETLMVRIDGQTRALTLIVEPIGGENGAKSGGACVVAFRDTSPVAPTAGSEDAAISSDATVEALEIELRATKAQLQ